jgi:hypothetical protein
MVLSDIAEGVEVTTEQREYGVASTDETGASLVERLAPFGEELPCSPVTAATLVEAYAEGASVGRAAAVAELPETTAAKTLYLLGEPIDPLSPTATTVLEDWMAGRISRNEARELVGVGDDEFALAVYVATHDPIDGIEAAIADALAVSRSADPLSDARSDVGELF